MLPALLNQPLKAAPGQEISRAQARQNTAALRQWKYLECMRSAALERHLKACGRCRGVIPPDDDSTTCSAALQLAEQADQATAVVARFSAAWTWDADADNAAR
jgi:hypothetical protein